MTLTPDQRQTLTWITAAALLLLWLLWLLWLLAPVLSPFVVAAVSALFALPVSAAVLGMRRVALRRARRACPGSPLYQG